MLQIAIIDDQPQLIRQLQDACALFDEVEVVFTAINGQQAIERMEDVEAQPDVILMDIEMPRMDGIEATKIIRAQFPDTQVLMLTVFDDETHIFQAILAGACGYILKGEKPSRVLQAIEDAHEHRMPMSPIIAAKAIQYLREELPTRHQARVSLSDYQLTPRELEILKLLSQGKTYPQIAEQLFISRKTVRNHVHNIYQKMSVKSKAEVITLANQNKWFWKK
ncbi:MAG: response regulator transcription factor [Bacteroidota bacterium]